MLNLKVFQCIYTYSVYFLLSIQKVVISSVLKLSATIAVYRLFINVVFGHFELETKQKGLLNFI